MIMMKETLEKIKTNIQEKNMNEKTSKKDKIDIKILLNCIKYINNLYNKINNKYKYNYNYKDITLFINYNNICINGQKDKKNKINIKECKIKIYEMNKKI